MTGGLDPYFLGDWWTDDWRMVEPKAAAAGPTTSVLAGLLACCLQPSNPGGLKFWSPGGPDDWRTGCLDAGGWLVTGGLVIGGLVTGGW